MELDLEKTLAALVKVARNNESTLSAVDRETIFSGARRLEFLCSAAAGRDPKDGRALSESLTSLLGELREWSEKAKRLETQVAELRWVATGYYYVTRKALPMSGKPLPPRITSRKP